MTDMTCPFCDDTKLLGEMTFVSIGKTLAFCGDGECLDRFREWTSRTALPRLEPIGGLVKLQTDYMAALTDADDLYDFCPPAKMGVYAGRLFDLYPERVDIEAPYVVIVDSCPYAVHRDDFQFVGGQKSSKTVDDSIDVRMRFRPRLQLHY